MAIGAHPDARRSGTQCRRRGPAVQGRKQSDRHEWDLRRRPAAFGTERSVDRCPLRARRAGSKIFARRRIAEGGPRGGYLAGGRLTADQRASRARDGAPEKGSGLFLPLWTASSEDARPRIREAQPPRKDQ